MLLFRTNYGPAIQVDDGYAALPGHEWDTLLARDDLPELLARMAVLPDTLMPLTNPVQLLAPVGSQEVWAAGGDFYDRVYHAERPELFLKATPLRVVGPGEPLRLRPDSKWNVPEPELTLLVSSGGRITGYTIGNDLSSRDIEGENPLYLPQAKTYDGCAALGPGIWISSDPIPADTRIELSIFRGGTAIFEGETELNEMKKQPETLVSFLRRALTFPVGCFLMTGTGIIPEDEFTLRAGDVVQISINPIGTLSNPITTN